MKKILFYLSLSAVLCITANSCISSIIPEDKPQEPEDPNKKPSTSTKDFSLSFNIKRTESGDASSASISIAWGDEDSVGVFMYGDGDELLYENRLYSMNGKAGYSSVTLDDTVTTLVNNAFGYGYFPYQPNVTGKTITNTLKNIQNQTASNDNAIKMDAEVSANLFMLSSVSDEFTIEKGRRGTLVFENIFTFLRFQVSKIDLDVPFGSGYFVSNVQLFIANKNDNPLEPLPYPLAGEYSIEMPKSKKPAFTSGKSYSKITADVTGGGQISSFTSNPYVWFIVNPTVLESNECLVAVVEASNGVRKYRINSTFDIAELKENNVYGFKVIATSTNTISDSETTTVFSEDKASNCYIVPRPGICQIPLNTANKLPLAGVKIDWLWASKENGESDFDIKELIDPSSFEIDPNGKFVRFRVGTIYGQGAKGNVILALKNANNQIVWTWHIWITDEPKDVTYYLGSNNKKFLDRNIGAMSAEPASPWINNFGFVYQWGRKDPFVGGNGEANETATTDGVLSLARNHTIVNTAAGASWMAPTATTATADFARQNPMRFICNNAAPVNPDRPLDNPVDWLSGGGAANRWSDTEKTDNDPCPPGYKTPSKADMAVLRIEEQSFWYFKNINQWYWEYFHSSGSRGVWPTAGMRQGRATYSGNAGGQLIYSGTEEPTGQCFYWTSTPASISGTAIPGGSHLLYTSNTLLTHPHSLDKFGDNADAYPVRCVRME